MDEKKPTFAQASANHHRLAGIIQSVILMAGCAVMTLPIVLWGEVVFLTLFPAVIFLVLFTLLFVPLVWTEIFDSHEWARRRPGERILVDLIPFYTGLGRILRPVLDQFSWWRPFSLGRFGEAVILPDSMAVFAVALASLVMATMEPLCLSVLVGQPVPSFWLYLLPLLLPAVLVSPFGLTAVLWVSREDVRLIRFFVVIPYWVHRVPHDAELPLWGFEDGMAFESPSRPLYELQLGTPTSALHLSHHIAAVLEKAGWQHSPSGHLPRMLRI